MALCKRCAKNGREQDGGSIGVCRQHAKTKCLICRAASLGEELCAAHAHQEELARWTAQANLRVIDPAAEMDLAEIRREKLMQAKFMAHQAVEVFFSGLLGAVQALWGSNDEETDERKAA